MRFHQTILFTAFCLVCTIISPYVSAQSPDHIDWYVSIEKGKNKNDGKSPSTPLKNIDKAIKEAAPGDVIAVAEGVYSGTRGCGYIICDKPVKLYGGYAMDFSRRDNVAHPTLFQAENQKSQRKAFLHCEKNVGGLVIDGFVFDMGERNSYDSEEGKPEGVETGMLLLPPKKNRAKGDKATVTEQCLYVQTNPKGGDVTVQNNVFVNGAKFGIQAGHKGGTFIVRNNVFVSNRMAAIEIFGTGGKKAPNPANWEKDGHVEIAYNTILFTWSRLKDFLDMGYGVRVMTKLSYDIHHNIIGGNIMAGVDHSRFNKDEWLKLDNNIFFVNKGGDLEYSAESNTKELINADEFEDLEFASVNGNRNMIPETLPVDKNYLQGYLSARYSETTDLDRDSPANQWRSILGMNLQGTMSSKVTMFANKYPWKNTLQLFGAVPGCGAQRMK
jgi:hypothetical protein